ncbi:MAG: FkbM family methyltransferase [Candidatus Velthaea sp.]
MSSVLRHPLNRGGKLQALRDYVFWNAARFTLDAEFVLHMPEGIDLLLGREQNYATSIYVHSLPDFAEMLFLSHLLREAELFADVGANVGMYSTWAAGSAGANVVAIEPVPLTFAGLTKNIRLNGLESLIDPLQVAVGESPGHANMSSSEGGLNHVLEHAVRPDSILASVMRLDDIFADKCPFAMKLDVEGFELRALSGARTILADVNLRAIIIELKNLHLNCYGTNVREVRQLLMANGFFPHRYDPFTRRVEPLTEHQETNEIFIRRNDAEVADRLSSARRIVLPGFSSGV